MLFWMWLSHATTGMAIPLTFCLLLVVALADSVYSTQRTLRSWMNPDCGDLCKQHNVTTLYLMATGPHNDTLHYLWDFMDKPSVLIAHSPTSTTLHIKWHDYLAGNPNSIFFDGEVTYTFGVILNKIIEFDDVNDTAMFDTANVNNTNALSLQYFDWRRVSLQNDSKLVNLDMEGNSYHDTAKNISRYGSIKLSLQGFCTTDHSDIMPHMLHTENSTQMDIILDHIETTKTFTNSRFAIELLVIGDGDPRIPMFIDPKKSVDDEHTPGIFEVVEVRTPPYKKLDDGLNAGAYLQWRPVSYNSASRDVTSSTETIQYPPKIFNHTSEVEGTMIYRYYNKTDIMTKLFLQKLTVSLGSKGDGFYKRTNYLTWTFLIGYGTPSEERFSSLVIMIISIGLGVPLLVMIITGLYLCIHRIPKQPHNVYSS